MSPGSLDEAWQEIRRTRDRIHDLSNRVTWLVEMEAEMRGFQKDANALRTAVEVMGANLRNLKENIQKEEIRSRWVIGIMVAVVSTGISLTVTYFMKSH